MGFFSDLVGGFTGESQKKALTNANNQSNADLQSGYDQASPYLQQASNAFAPYAQSGQQANQFYNDALGLNGDAARTTATNTLTSNPLFQGQLGQDSNAMSRILNAQGASGGGKAQLAAQRVFQQTAGNWLDRYAAQGAQGFQAANGQANAFTNQGNLEYGYGATKAGQATQYGNAMAGAAGIGANNLINVAGTVAKAVALSDVRMKRDIEWIGETPAGLPLYRFKYLTGDEDHVGVMAHEAREKFPEAVIERPDGFLMVDYARIG